MKNEIYQATNKFQLPLQVETEVLDENKIQTRSSMKLKGVIV